MSIDIDQQGMHELDRRSSDGFEVTLLWSELTGSVFVCVEDHGRRRLEERVGG